MPLSVTDLQTPLTIDQIKAIIFEIISNPALGFPVEAWQPNGAARSFIEAQAAVAAEQSGVVASLARMPYLPTSEGDFLDHLLVSHFDELRQQAGNAKFPLNFINQGGTTHGPLAVGAVTVRASNGQTFKNDTIITVTAGVTTIVNVTAEFAGASGNIPPQTLELVTPLAGVVVTFSGSFTVAGSETESDPRAKERASTKWAALRIDRVAEGFLNLARNAAPAVTGVVLDDENPRGPGTADLYLAALNATAGAADVIAVQAALDDAIFGNDPSGDKLVLAIAAPTQTINLVISILYSGVNAIDLRNGLELAWRTFLNSVPIGGFDFSPGPSNTITTSQVITALKVVHGVVSVEIAKPFIVPANHKAIEGVISFTLIQVNAP